MKHKFRQQNQAKMMCFSPNYNKYSQVEIGIPKTLITCFKKFKPGKLKDYFLRLILSC